MSNYNQSKDNQSAPSKAQPDQKSSQPQKGSDMNRGASSVDNKSQKSSSDRS